MKHFVSKNPLLEKHWAYALVDADTLRYMRELDYTAVKCSEDYDGLEIGVTPAIGADVARMLCFLRRTEQLPASWMMAFAKRCLRADGLTDEGHAALALWLCKPPGVRTSPAIEQLVALIKRSPILFEMGCRS